MIGITKNDGTTNKRGLGIAHYVWRLGLSEVIGQHRPWIQSWLNQGIRSGPGRQMDDIIENLMDDLFDAEENDENLLGAKIDIAKFFDRCDIKRSVRILSRLGAPKQLTYLLLNFYEQLRIWVEVNGIVAKDHISPARCLLQGCPGSMLCAIAEMHVWATSVNVLHPQVELACYVDDRLLYAPGPDAQECVQDAVATTLRYDTDAGWEWNEKGEVWSSRTPLQDPLDFQPHVGPEKDHVSMVGITLPVDIAQRDVAERDSYFTASRKA